MKKLKIYDRRTELHKEIKYLVCFMAGICVCGLGFRIEAKLNEPTWTDKQLVLNLEPFQGSCQGFNCIIDKNDFNGFKVQKVMAAEPKKKKYQLSDKALNCVANHPQVASKISEKFGEYGQYAIELFSRESSLDQYIINPTSGACGLTQSYPCEKMKCDLSDLDCQINWGFNYIKNRYGNAENALNFHINNNYY
jgi:hypothetical protein